MAHAFEGSNPSLPKPFYQESGLRFECQRCSACCRLTPGFVFLTHTDLSDLMKTTGIPALQFAAEYLRVVNIGGFYRISLKEKENYDCIFWADGGCLVYEQRPYQCRSFPFWESLLVSADVWREHQQICPGIGKGAVHTFDEIESWRRGRLVQQFIEIFPAYDGEPDESILDRLAKEKEIGVNDGVV